MVLLSGAHLGAVGFDLNRLTITPEDADRLDKALRPFLGVDAYSDDVLARLRDAVALVLPVELQNTLYALRDRKSTAGSLLISGVANNNCDLPPTPIHAATLPKHQLTLPSEIVELGIALQLGEPLAYQAEKTGALIQHVFPILSQQKSPSNESSGTMIDLHTELVFSRNQPNRPLDENSPDFLLLLCNRSDRYKQARTLVVDVATLCAKLSAAQLGVLRQPRFKLRAPYSFTGDKPDDRPWIGPSAIIKGPPNTPSAAFDLACGTKGLDAEAERALDAVRNATCEPGVVSHHKLVQGDLLIIDNRRCIHGRTPFLAVYSGTDRWLQRVYVRVSLENMTPYDLSWSTRVF